MYLIPVFMTCKSVAEVTSSDVVLNKNKSLQA